MRASHYALCESTTTPVLTPSSSPPGVAVWPVGTVVLYAAALLPCRTNLRKRIQTPLTRATRFLHKDYKVECFFWELLELNRRNCLVGWVLLFPTEKTFLRLVFGLLSSIVMLTLLLSVGPYARAEGGPRSFRFVVCLAHTFDLPAHCDASTAH